VPIVRQPEEEFQTVLSPLFYSDLRLSQHCGVFREKLFYYFRVREPSSEVLESVLCRRARYQALDFGYMKFEDHRTIDDKDKPSAAICNERLYNWFDVAE